MLQESASRGHLRSACIDKGQDHCPRACYCSHREGWDQIALLQNPMPLPSSTVPQTLERAAKSNVLLRPWGDTGSIGLDG
jgi:hypothetical protein